MSNSFLSSVAGAFAVIKEITVQPKFMKITPVFSELYSFSFYIRSTILKFILCECGWCEEGDQLHSLAWGYPVVPASLVENCSFPIELS